MEYLRIFSQLCYYLVIAFMECLMTLPSRAIRFFWERDSLMKIFHENISNINIRNESTYKMRISVIIPCYNEVEGIIGCIESATRDYNVEIIVCDGGSRDGTLELISSLKSCIVLKGSTTRAQCVVQGANAASGDILLFLHGDCELPNNYGLHVRLAVCDSSGIAGAFMFKPQSNKIKGLKSLILGLITLGTNLRSMYLQYPYGDQALFFRRDVYDRLGGFDASLPFMEDFEFIGKAKKLGKIIILPVPVLTSARRWEMNGVLFNTLLNQVRYR